MKKMIVIVTLIMFLKPILPVFEYVLNYEYIISELCENKATPENINIPISKFLFIVRINLGLSNKYNIKNIFCLFF